MKYILPILLFLHTGFGVAEQNLSPVSSVSRVLSSDWLSPQPISQFRNISGLDGPNELVQLFNTPKAERVFFAPLRERNLDVKISVIKQPSGTQYINMDIYPISDLAKDMMRPHIISNRKYNRDLVGDVTGISDRSIGRIQLLTVKKDGYGSVIIREIQSSQPWRILEQENQVEGLLEENWRKDVTYAIARALALEGISEIYGMSERSMQGHPKFRKKLSEEEKKQLESKDGDGYVKVFMNPRDLRNNYRKVFSNRNVWGSPELVDFSVFSTKDGTYAKSKVWLGNLPGYTIENYHLHQYQRPDIVLNLKNIWGYRFREFTNKRGETKLLVVFEDPTTSKVYQWDYENLIRRLSNTSFPEYQDLSQLIEGILKLGISQFHEVATVSKSTATRKAA